MEIKIVKTKKIEVGENLHQILDTCLPQIEENTIIAITSKIVSLCEKSVVKKKRLCVTQKLDLIKKHAKAYLDPENNPYGVSLTLYHNLLLPSAGIDESNGKDLFILYPKNVQKSCNLIWKHLKKVHSIQNCGVIITDSHTTPLRKGVIGVSLAFCGFKPLLNYVGKKDCFGKKMQMTYRNNIDALAVTAVFCMGEGKEQTPIALIKNAPQITFVQKPPTKKDRDSTLIPLKEDLYAPVILSAPWKWKQN